MTAKDVLAENDRLLAREFKDAPPADRKRMLAKVLEMKRISRREWEMISRRKTVWVNPAMGARKRGEAIFSVLICNMLSIFLEI